MGRGFSLDGIDDFVLVPDSGNLNITGDVTVDLWAKRTVFGQLFNPVMISKGSQFIGSGALTAYGLGFTDSGDQILAYFERADGTFVGLKGTALTDSEFHHYAYVRGGNTHKLFMNGAVVANRNFTETPGNTSGLPQVIGAEAQGTAPIRFARHFGGVID